MTPIEAIMRRLGATQNEIATIVGRDQSTVSRWKAGQGVPNLDDIAAIRAEFIRRGFVWDDSILFNTSTGEAA